MRAGIYFVTFLFIFSGQSWHLYSQKECSVISLDTILNKTKSIFRIASTDAPLYFEDATGKPDPSSMVGALQMLDEEHKPVFSIYRDIYNAKENKLQIGNKQYPLNFWDENNFLIQANSFVKHSSQNPCKNPYLSINSAKGPQTIILFPQHWYNNCQPVIFIGKNQLDGTLLALTYVVNYRSDQAHCCWQTQNQPCLHDLIYKAPWDDQTGSPFVCNTHLVDSKPLGGENKSPLKRGRLKLVIDLLNPHNADSDGWAASLQALPDYCCAGAPDFSLTLSH